MNRRTFLRTTTAASSIMLSQTGRLFALEAGSESLQNIGIQLYTLRKELAKDPVGTLKQVAAAGYKQVELFGFPNADPLINGAKEAGLAIHSTHFEWDSVVNPKDAELSDFKKILEKAGANSISHLVVPYLKSENTKDLDAYKKVAESLNKAAALAKRSGIELSYHNHNFEFQPKDGGKTGYDVFIEEFSDDMKFEIDVFWVKAAGIDPTSLIEKLTGRVTQLHLKDLKEGIAIPSFASLPEDAFQEIGNGIIPMAPILAAAKNAGVKHCHVEQDQSPDALASIRKSIAFLKQL